MSFRLVPKSVTLNDLERCNDPYSALLQFAAYGAYYSTAKCIEVVEDVVAKKVHFRYLIAGIIILATYEDYIRRPYRGAIFLEVTGQLADTPTRGLPTRGLDKSRTGQLAVSQMPPKRTRTHQEMRQRT